MNALFCSGFFTQMPLTNFGGEICPCKIDFNFGFDKQRTDSLVPNAVDV